MACTGHFGSLLIAYLYNSGVPFLERTNEMENFNAQFISRQYDENGECYITLHITGMADREIVKTLEKGTYYRLSAKEIKSKRTLEQNAYLWAIIHEIATARDGELANTESDLQVYCEILKKADAKHIDFVIDREVLKEIKTKFRAVEILAGFEDKLNIRAYIGSSKFDKQEFGKLLDFALELAEQEGIDTRPYEIDYTK